MARESRTRRVHREVGLAADTSVPAWLAALLRTTAATRAPPSPRGRRILAEALSGDAPRVRPPRYMGVAHRRLITRPNRTTGQLSPRIAKTGRSRPADRHGAVVPTAGGSAMSQSTRTVEGHHDQGAVIPPDIYDPAVSALRFLAVDAVNKAQSGHPGTPLDIAPVIFRLYTQHLRHDPADPDWPDRDRFVLSGGHASMVLYGALHLAGYDVPMDQIQRFRQLGSRCAGHPERGLLPGIEVTTGPLGQGVANAIGMAIAERLLAARFNVDGLDVVDHRVVVECGDGDLMEGVSAEASSLAGHLGLGKLTLLYDDNQVTLDGPTRWTFTEDVATRYLGYGWHVVRLEEVDDLAEIDLAMMEATAETERPTIVIMHSHIGIGTPLHDDHRAHGKPIGPQYASIARDLLHWPHPPFVIPEDVYRTWRSQVADRAAARQDWLDRFAAYRSAHPDLAAEFERRMSGQLPAGWDADLPRFTAGGDDISTRVAGGRTLQV